MGRFLITTGGIGSESGKLDIDGIMKWIKAGAYLLGSAAVVGMLNELTQLVAHVDWASMTINLFGIFEINGSMIGMAVTNLIAYLLELVVRDTRK